MNKWLSGLKYRNVTTGGVYYLATFLLSDEFLTKEAPIFTCQEMQENPEKEYLRLF